MSILFLLLVVISSCIAPMSFAKGDKDDGTVLLKIKEQLGNPEMLNSWSKDTVMYFCSWWTVRCSSTGRVSSISLDNYNTNLSVPFPRSICDLTELEELTISRAPFYGPIPSCISKLSNLFRLDITGTSLSGSLPDFPYHQKLKYFTVSGNKISGSIPSSLATLPNLLYLDLSSNYLTGTIPSGLVHNDSSTLLLYNNNLTGEIPKCYGWVDFSVFHVANNKLSGDASFLFRKENPVYGIDLSSNKFEFDLSYVQIPQRLNVLDLSHNKIWGRVPDSIANSETLFPLNLQYNNLCGELPQGSRMWRFDASSFANNPCLCGKPLPPCSHSAAAPGPI